MVIRFGKHKGQRIKDIPTDYLRWMSGESFDWKLKKAVNEELARREDPDEEIADFRGPKQIGWREFKKMREDQEACKWLSVILGIRVAIKGNLLITDECMGSLFTDLKTRTK